MNHHEIMILKPGCMITVICTIAAGTGLSQVDINFYGDIIKLVFVFDAVFLRPRPIECWRAKIRTKKDGLVRFWICEYQKIYHTFNRVVHGSPTWGQLTQVGTPKFNEPSWCATTICSRPSGPTSYLWMYLVFPARCFEHIFLPKFRNIIAGEYISRNGTLPGKCSGVSSWAFAPGRLYAGLWSGSLRTASFGPATLR